MVNQFNIKLLLWLITFLVCPFLQNNAVTQKNNTQKAGVELEWEAPPDFEGPVNFM